MLMQDFENQLVKVFNENPLPFEAKRYVVLAFVNTIESAYKHQIEEIRKQEEKPDEQVSQQS